MPERTLPLDLAGIPALDLRRAVRLRGAVVEAGDGVAQVVGIPGVGSEELVTFDSGALGMAFELSPGPAGVVILGADDRVGVGDGVETTGRLPGIPVGGPLFGRVLDPLGRPLDDRPAPGGARRALFADAPGLTDRAPVHRPLLTGVMVIDAAIPIGRGQRQLIVGDRNVGKSALALDMVAAQRTSGVACVYVVIGQPISRMLSTREHLEKSGAFEHTIVIASDAGDPPGLQYLAPYAGMSVAEQLCESGRDVLVVFDDLTKHADAYRQLSLLLGRPPGREAFPGDIFYIHAQLLERATAMSPERGGGSITAFPIVETTDSDISSYIPTNLISITDGQIYLDAALFERNQRPAVDVGRSVSRVGGAAQPDALRAAARNLRILASRFEALEALTRVGLDVDPATRQAVERGRVLRELLKQPRFTRRSPADQIFALTALQEGWLDGRTPAGARASLWSAAERARAAAPAVMTALDDDREATDDWRARLQALIEPAAENAS